MELSIGERSSNLRGQATATIRCGLCRETIELESNFRATPTVCPHCGLKFTFDPQKQPLPLSGLRLSMSAVSAAQRPREPSRHRVHDAHLSKPLAAPIPQPPARTNVMAWLGTLALAIAGVLTLMSWIRR
jgi:hypothetical protein